MKVPELKKVSSITNKLKEMELQESALVEQIEKLNKDIAQLKSQTISQSTLRGIFKYFTNIYDSLSVESRRLLNKLLFMKIISYNERGKNSGELELIIRADGKLKSNWPKTVNPELLSSQLRGHWLRVSGSDGQPFG